MSWWFWVALGERQRAEHERRMYQSQFDHEQRMNQIRSGYVPPPVVPTCTECGATRASACTADFFDYYFGNCCKKSLP